MPTLKTIAMGAGAVGAAGIAVITPPILNNNSTEEAIKESDQYSLCLKADLQLFKGADARCYNRKEIYSLLDKPLVNRDGASVSVRLTHPSDASIAPNDATTCRQYREYMFDGWFAMTSRDMRREGYFKRACGVLTALFEAQKASTQFFANGSPTDEEIAGLAPTMRMGEASNLAESISVSRSDGYRWEINIGEQTVFLTELANADFDNDGIEEILGYSAGVMAGGSARFYHVGLIEKDNADAPLRFTVMDFDQDQAAGAGG